MNQIFNNLLSKYISILESLTFGNLICRKDIEELWHLLHILHYVSYDNSSIEALKILDYYGE